MIKANAHKYSVSAMCRVLKVNRSTYYYEAKSCPDESELVSCNESNVKNVLNRQFKEQAYRNVVVSDLTYVRVGLKWNYVCVLVDLFNREIIGYSAGEHRSAELVKQAFQSVEGNLEEIKLFHTDRGNEFKNQVIEEILENYSPDEASAKALLWKLLCTTSDYQEYAQCIFKIVNILHDANITYDEFGFDKLQNKEYIVTEISFILTYIG